MTTAPQQTKQPSALDRLPRASFYDLAEKVKMLTGTPFVLQIGAMDGILFDILNPNLKQGGWQGLLVEPLPDMFAHLQNTYANYPELKLVNCAISDHEGTLTLRRANPEAIAQGLLPKEALGVTSSYTDRGIHARSDFQERFAAHMLEVQAPCLRLQKLLDDNDVKKIDVIVIDAEGADWLIAQQIDFARYKPRLFCIEYSNLKPDEIKACCAHLSALGYGLAICQEDIENMIFYKNQEATAP